MVVREFGAKHAFLKNGFFRKKRVFLIKKVTLCTLKCTLDPKITTVLSSQSRKKTLRKGIEKGGLQILGRIWRGRSGIWRGGAPKSGGGGPRSGWRLEISDFGRVWLAGGGSRSGGSGWDLEGLGPGSGGLAPGSGWTDKGLGLATTYLTSAG